MSTVVLDTSVAVAWYLPETFQAAARAWWDRMAAGTASLVVPTLHFWEFGNVLRTHVRRGDLTAEQAMNIYQLHLQAPLVIVDPDRTRVLETALVYGSTVYDAVYVALSLELGARLVTAERSTTPWVARLGDAVEVLARDS